VAQLPRQIGFGLAETAIVGSGFTTSATVRVLAQPAWLPVTVYVVFEEGETVTLAPVSDPGCQVYVLAPVALSVADCPAQMAVGEALAFTVGNGTTDTVMLAMLVQVPLLPVTV
jgi:hypothetical protein